MKSDNVVSTIKPPEQLQFTAPGTFNSDGIILITAVPFLLYYAARSIVRRFSRDSTELIKDRAESDVIKILQGDAANLREENEKLRSGIDRVSEERNIAVSQLGKFIAETEANRTRVNELQESITLMGKKLDEQTTLLQTVLLENAQLKSQVGHLEQLNERLEREVNNLEVLIERLNKNYSSSLGK